MTEEPPIKVISNSGGIKMDFTSINEISNNVLNKESGNKGEDKEISEMILSWNEAQDYFGYDTLCWLNNEYLSSCAEDISFIVSNDDIRQL